MLAVNEAALTVIEGCKGLLWPRLLQVCGGAIKQCVGLSCMAAFYRAFGLGSISGGIRQR